MTAPAPWRPRLVLSLLVGLALGWKVCERALRIPGSRDFDQVWFAARAILHGQNPYALIGPGLAFDWGFPFFYPLPAAVAVTPLAPLPVMWAGAVFFGIGMACFTWALMAHGYPPLLGLLGAPIIGAVESVQWSPLLAASVVLSPLAVLLVAKPTIGAAMFVARPSWWAVAGAVVLSGLAFAINPHWVLEWRHALRAGHHLAAPITQRGGVVALLALLRWRRPEARLIVALACVPQTMLMYEAVPLLLVPRATGEAAAFVLVTYLAQYLTVITQRATDSLYAGGPWLWLVYGAAVVMVLRRPNEGPVPALRWPVLPRRVVL